MRLRFVAAVVAAVLLGLLVHHLDGAPLPTSCGVLGVAALVGSATTALAVVCGHRHRGSWAALGVLAVGQTAIDAALSSGTLLRPPTWGWGLLVHPVAALMLGGLVLGVDRVREDLLGVLDRVVTRWWAGVRVPAPVRVSVPAPTPRARGGAQTADPCRPLRGPPGSSAGPVLC